MLCVFEGNCNNYFDNNILLENRIFFNNLVEQKIFIRVNYCECVLKQKVFFCCC